MTVSPALRTAAPGDVLFLTRKAFVFAEDIKEHNGGAGLYGNCADYTRVLTVLLNQGKDPQSGAQILKPETVDELFKPQLSEKQLDGFKRKILDKYPPLINLVSFT